MNSKKLKTQLLAAVAMTLVAVIALGSSTFAWFAANKTVTASSVDISATSDQPFLQISGEAAGTYSTAATLSTGNSATNLKLTTPLNLSDNLIAYKANQAAEDTVTTTPTAATKADEVKWGTAYSTKTNEVQGDKVPWDVTNEKTQYVLETHVYLRTAENTKGYKLKMEVPTVDAGTNSISEAFRIVAVAEDGSWMMYNKGTDVVTACANGYLVQDIAQEKNVTKAYNDITIYVYFDGKDNGAYTDVASDLSKITSNLVFSCTETAT